MWGLLHRGRCVCVCVCDILLAETQKKDSHFVTIEKDIEEQKEKKTKRVDSSEKIEIEKKTTLRRIQIKELDQLDRWPEIVLDSAARSSSSRNV